MNLDTYKTILYDVGSLNILKTYRHLPPDNQAVIRSKVYRCLKNEYELYDSTEPYRVAEEVLRFELEQLEINEEYELCVLMKDCIDNFSEHFYI